MTSSSLRHGRLALDFPVPAFAKIPTLLLAGLLALTLAAAPAGADISGTVLVEGSGDPGIPIAGARVHLQTDLTTVIVTGVDGTFTLPVAGAGPFVVTAGVEYDRDSATNFLTGGAEVATDDATGVEIRLMELPLADEPNYDVPTAKLCASCHPVQFSEWQQSNHSFASSDTWVRDLYSGDGTAGGGAGYVFRDTHDADDTGFCAVCHNTMEDVFDPGNVFFDEASTPAGIDGVTCVACHQMDSINEDVNALGHLGNATYRFPDGDLPTSQFVWGPLDDVVFAGMRASYAPHFRDSLMCASCHQYQNPDTGAPGQSTYSEWLDSPYAVAGPDFRSCQDCHMEANDESEICFIGDQPVRPSEQNKRHDFVGSTPDTLAEALLLTTVAEDADGVLTVRAEVTNSGGGHSFPTGVSIRNAILVLEATWNGQPLEQLSGPQIPFWADDDVPGKQEGDYAGDPGKGFAKVLEGRINGQGEVMRPVLFIDAEGVYSDTLIPATETDVTEVELILPPGSLPGDTVEVSARLLYRRAWRALAVTKGWTQTPQGGPVEIEVTRNDLAVTLTSGGLDPLAIPTLGTVGLALLVGLMVVAALALLRRRGV